MSPSASSAPRGEGWRLRPYRRGDERWIVERFESIFHRPMSEESWRWKLKTQPSPVENVWLAVDREDRPIFQYAAVPRHLRLPGAAVNVLVLVDLWTAPEYRRRGIFTASARWVHEQWRRAGIAGVLSPFNARHEPRYRRLGWRYLFPLRWLIRPLRPEMIAARRLGIRGLASWAWLGAVWNRPWRPRVGENPGLEDVETAETAPPLDEPERPLRYRFSLAHDAAWLRWRYYDCAHHAYALRVARRCGRRVGHLAFRIDESEGRRFAFLAELVGDDPEVERSLIDDAVGFFTERSVVAIATLAIPGTGLYQAFRRRGFLFTWGRFAVHWLPLSDDPPLAELRDPNSWEMAGGDYDVI